MNLSDRTDNRPYPETTVARPLLHCVFCGVADNRCYTPTSFRKDGISQSKDGTWRVGFTEKLASEAYDAAEGIAWQSTANRAIVGH